MDIAIADDHEMFAQGLASILANSEYINNIIIAKNGEELIQKIKQQSVQVLLLDIDMPVLNGESTFETIRELWPEIKVIILTMHDEAAYIQKFLDLEVDGYLLKNADADELIKAINSVNSGNKYVNSNLLVKVQKAKQAQLENNREVDLLTPRELEIVKLTSENKSIAEISTILFISEHTVKSHRKNILRKLNLNNSLAITKFAFENNLV